MLIKNKRVSFDYFIEDTLVAGIKLEGWEVKAILAGRMSVNECYVRIMNDEIFIVGSTVSPIPSTNRSVDADPTRNRKLLVTKSQRNKWHSKVKLAGYTMMLLDVHYSDTKKIKATIGLCKGKKSYDKRATIKERDIAILERREGT